MDFRMSRRGRIGWAVCENLRCGIWFSRRMVDLRRSPRHFCSRQCRDSVKRTGRTMVEVTCSGCGVLFPKIASNASRSRHHYCTPGCYTKHVDRAALGRSGGIVPRHVPLLLRFMRSSAAGKARGRNLSKEQLREIAMKGVRARVAKGATRAPNTRHPFESRKMRPRLSWYGPLLAKGTGDGG